MFNKADWISNQLYFILQHSIKQKINYYMEYKKSSG